MGGASNNWTHITAWTFLYLVQVLTADRNLFSDLGLNTLPDVRKINISQEEYTRMMTAYLSSRQNSKKKSETIPKLITFHMVKPNNLATNHGNSLRMKFHINRTNDETEVDSALLRFLAPSSPIDIVRVQLNQILGARRKKLLEENILYLSNNSTKWCEFDVTSAVQSWLNGNRNLGIELICLDCVNRLEPIIIEISALIYPEHRRYKRSNTYQQRRRTDCDNNKGNNINRKCCRQDMTVKFADLKFPEMKHILQPKTYEAGVCQGKCPINYHHATNHSRIQSLVHKMERKNAISLNRKVIPKPCCAPTKLEPLEILRVNPADTTKLLVEKWDNMQVIECACA